MPTYHVYLPRNGNFSRDIEVARVAASGLFADVVILKADSLEEVFAKLNHGSGQELEGYRGRSLSVGDVVRNPDGKALMCDICGWTFIDA